MVFGSALLTIVLAGAPVAAAVPDAADVPPAARGYGEAVAPLTPEQVQRLYLLGKVWGFLKYHHPQVTEGCFDWDAELVARIAELETATGDARTLLAGWIAALGERPCEKPPVDDVQSRPDIGWLADHDLLGFELGSTLRSLETRAASTDPQFFVTRDPAAALPRFRNEPDYPDAAVGDERYRLLALMRFWNMVEYWYPYRSSLGNGWDDALRAFIPRFRQAGDDQDYRLVLKALVARLGDGAASPSAVTDGVPPGGRAQPPFEIRNVEGQPFVGRRLALLGEARIEYPPGECLQYGDLLLEVDGTPVDERMEPWAPYYAASAEGSRRARLMWNLLRGDDDIVTALVDRAGVHEQVQCLRMPVETIDAQSGRSHDRAGVTLQLLSEDVAYLRVSSIDRSRIANYISAAERTRGLVVDLRGAASPWVAEELGRHFVDVDAAYAVHSVADLSQPGTFRWSAPAVLQPMAPHYAGRVVLLVDETTQGPAELAAMALQSSPDALVVGSRTAGAPAPVTTIVLPGGLTAAISGIGVFYADRSPVQTVGIVPDVDVEPTIEGMREGRDEVLEAAIREIVGDALDDERIRDLAAQPAD